MTSVQNRRQLLNGSNYFLVILAVTLLFCACSSSKSSLSDRDRATKSTDADKGSKPSLIPLDTIHWTVVPEEIEKPITGKELFGPGIIRKDVYNISLFIPLMAKQEFNGPQNLTMLNENRFLNFYAGGLLALKELEKEGLSLNVHVFDTERNQNLFKTQLNSLENRRADLIIGPYDRENVRLAAQWAKDNKVPMISPWQASTLIANENAYYIQLRPNLDRHYEKMVIHSLEEFSPEQIFLLGRKNNANDQARIKGIQNMFSHLTVDNDSFLLQEYYVSEETLLQVDSLFNDLLFQDKPTCFIIPNWGSDDEDFIYSAMRKLNVDKGLKEVYVYGMPLILESEKISFDLYRNLKVRVVRSTFVDYEQEDVIVFEKNYFHEYGAIPTEDAFEGFDVIRLAGQALQKFGIAFQYYIDQEIFPFLQTSYRIERNFSDEEFVIDRFSEINYFENHHLDIIEYKNEQFQRSGR